LAGGKTSLGLLLAGIVVLDMGTQGMQITNQAVIYTLRPEARSRINSAYMFCYFVGGAVGSLTAGLVLAADGWPGVCWLGAGFGVLTLGMVVVDRRWPAAETVPPPGEPTAGGTTGPPGLSAAPAGDVATADADDLDQP